MKRYKRIGEVLLDRDLIDEEELESVLYHARLFGLRLGDSACQLGYISDSEVARALSEHVSIPFIDLKKAYIDENVLNILPVKFCIQNQLVCYKLEADKLFIAVLDPIDTKVIDEVSIITGMELVQTVCSKDGIEYVFNRFFQNSYGIKDNNGLTDNKFSLSLDKEKNECFRLIYLDILNFNASQLHIEFLEKEINVRYRIYGALYYKKNFPDLFYKKIVDSIKEDNNSFKKIKININGIIENIIIENHYFSITDSVIIKIHRQSDIYNLCLDNLGMEDVVYNKYISTISKETGVFFITGSFLQGVSTTLYSSMQYLNSSSLKMVIISKFQEYTIGKIKSVNLLEKKEKTKEVLDNILEQYYDIIMIDDISDKEILNYLLNSHIKYRLLLVGVHTNDPIVFFQDLFNLNSFKQDILFRIRGILSQKLVKIMCCDCKYKRNLNYLELQESGNVNDKIQQVYDTRGCENCNYTGVSSQTGIFEFIEFNDINKLVNEEVLSYDVLTNFFKQNN